MICIGYGNECTCSLCLKKYSRWQKAIIKIETQECFEELKKARSATGLDNNETMKEINKDIQNYLR